jgi:hypothetical protein
VYAFGLNNKLWGTNGGPGANGNWSEWEWQTPNAGIAPGYSGFGTRFDLWLINGNADVMHMGVPWETFGWHSIGHPPYNGYVRTAVLAPAAVSWDARRIDVYVGIGQALQHKWTNL